MKPKPTEGAPCNGCGKCCQNEICGIGKEIYGEKVAAPCPALTLESGRYWCMFVLAEDMTGSPALIGNALGIGKGCCSDDR